MNIFDPETDPRLRAEILSRLAGELMTDRERARLFGLPEGCRIREHAKIIAPEKLKCGVNLYIGEGVILDCQGGLEIGDNTQFSAGVMVWSHSSHRQAVKGTTGISRKEIIYKATKIGKNVFLGTSSVIGAGVTIGDRVVVQALTFVNRDLGDDEIYGTERELRSVKKRIDALEAMVRGGK
jgi:acetyltransferase-like isoleucine patch superfamily enzyme